MNSSLRTLLVFLLLLFTFCESNQDFKKEISELDSLMVVVKSEQKKNSALKHKINQKSKDIFLNKITETKKIFNDTLPYPFKESMELGFNSINNLQTCIQLSDSLSKLCKQYLEQIITLKEDAQKHRIKNELATDYFRNEKKQIKSLIQIFRQTTSEMETLDNNLNKTILALDSLTDLKR